YSLAPVAGYLAKHLNCAVQFERDYLGGLAIEPGTLVLCENVRFNVGETANSQELSKQLAALCDVFVMDAFGTAHRKQASTYGVAEFAPIVAAGPLLLKELEAVHRVMESPKKP